MLTAIDLDDELQPVAKKIHDIRADVHLPTEMRPLQVEVVAKMPPKLSLGIRR